MRSWLSIISLCPPYFLLRSLQIAAPTDLSASSDKSLKYHDNAGHASDYLDAKDNVLGVIVCCCGFTFSQMQDSKANGRQGTVAKVGPFLLSSPFYSLRRYCWKEGEDDKAKATQYAADKHFPQMSSLCSNPLDKR